MPDQTPDPAARVEVEQLPVTQADHEAAADLFTKIGLPGCASAAASILYPDDPGVQAFARHRIQSIADTLEAQSARVAAAQEALADCLYSPDEDDFGSAYVALCYIAPLRKALAALSPALEKGE